MTHGLSRAKKGSCLILGVVTLAVCYQGLAWLFRPMRNLPYMHESVIYSEGSINHLLNAKGKQTASWNDEVFLVTPYYLIDTVGTNPQVSGSNDAFKVTSIQSPSDSRSFRTSADVDIEKPITAAGRDYALMDKPVIVSNGTFQGHRLYRMNLKTGELTYLPGIVSARSNYTSPNYAGITSSGKVQIYSPGKQPENIYTIPFALSQLREYNLTWTNGWDYDPSTNRLAFITPKGGVTIVIKRDVTTWYPPGLVVPQSIYLEPNSSRVWVVEGAWPVNWCTVVYNNRGRALARSASSTQPYTFLQPLTQSEYSWLQHFSTELKFNKSYNSTIK